MPRLIPTHAGDSHNLCLAREKSAADVDWRSWDGRSAPLLYPFASALTRSATRRAASHSTWVDGNCSVSRQAIGARVAGPRDLAESYFSELRSQHAEAANLPHTKAHLRASFGYTLLRQRVARLPRQERTRQFIAR